MSSAYKNDWLCESNDECFFTRHEKSAFEVFDGEKIVKSRQRLK